MSRDHDRTGGRGSVQFKPGWDGESDKPTPAVVRRRKDAAELFTRSAADEEDLALMEEESRELRRQQLITVVVIGVVAIGLLAAVYYWQQKPVYDVDATSTTLIGDSLVSVKVTARMNRPGKIVFGGESKPLPKDEDTEVMFRVPFSELSLGANEREVVITLANGEEVTRKKVTLYKDVELQIDESKVRDPGHFVYFRFRIPDGWKVRMQKEDHTKANPVAKFSMAQVFENIDAIHQPVYRFDMPIKIIRPNQEQYEYTPRIEVPLPATSLEISTPGSKRTLTSDARVEIIGRAEPGSKVAVGGAEVKVLPDGKFGASVDIGDPQPVRLPEKASREALGRWLEREIKKHGVEVEVVADAPDKVPTAKYLDFLRVSAEVAKRYERLMGGR